MSLEAASQPTDALRRRSAAAPPQKRRCARDPVNWLVGAGVVVCAGWLLGPHVWLVGLGTIPGLIVWGGAHTGTGRQRSSRPKGRRARPYRVGLWVMQGVVAVVFPPVVTLTLGYPLSPALDSFSLRLDNDTWQWLLAALALASVALTAMFQTQLWRSGVRARLPWAAEWAAWFAVDLVLWLGIFGLLMFAASR